MIKYSLSCENNHQFDGWFGSSAAYDEQRAAGLVTCPFCDSMNVEKTLMAPAVSGTKKTSVESEILPPMPAPGASEIPAVPAAGTDLVRGDETMKAVVEKMRELRQWVESNADNVGNQFAEEARKIHYGEEEARGIFGNATHEEARELHEEGIDFLPLPSLPEEGN